MIVIKQKRSAVITAIAIPVATHFAPSFLFHSHSLRLRKLAAQSQNKNANQRQIIVNGNTTFVAPFAR